MYAYICAIKPVMISRPSLPSLVSSRTRVCTCKRTTSYTLVKAIFRAALYKMAFNQVQYFPPTPSAWDKLPTFNPSISQIISLFYMFSCTGHIPVDYQLWILLSVTLIVEAKPDLCFARRASEFHPTWRGPEKNPRQLQTVRQTKTGGRKLFLVILFSIYEQVYDEVSTEKETHTKCRIAT